MKADQLLVGQRVRARQGSGLVEGEVTRVFPTAVDLRLSRSVNFIWPVGEVVTLADWGFTFVVLP